MPVAFEAAWLLDTRIIPFWCIFFMRLYLSSLTLPAYPQDT